MLKAQFLKKLTLTILRLFMLFIGTNLSGQTLPTGFQPVTVGSGWNMPLGVCFDQTGRMFVWEKAGLVWIVDTNGVKQSTSLIDISEEVGNWSDHGLNGFALDPNFMVNGYFYLYYTVDRHHLLNYGTPNYNPATNLYNSATIARVTRYRADPASGLTTTLLNSRTILIGEDKKSGIPVLHKSHSGGQLCFGSDGSLLVATGDGASYSGVDTGGTVYSYWSQAVTDSIIFPEQNVGAFRSQLMNCLNGKILRINPSNGNGLSSNPFYNASDPRSPQSRIYAFGLRNPYRFIVKPGTGSTDITAGDPGILIIGDVGHNVWEEINLCSQPGLNFGWPLYEGLQEYTNYVIASPYNRYAPNLLYGMSGCSEPFFRFSDLLIQETLNTPFWPNPCDSLQSIPNTAPRFMHTRPVLDIKHSNLQTRTGIFINGIAAEIKINDPLSPVTGPLFNSSASIAGAWYAGNTYPVQFQNTYFHCDYSKMWLRAFKFNANHQLTEVMNFGTNMGPISHVEYNPHDKLLYYISLPFDIYKLTYNANVNQLPKAIAFADTIYGYAPFEVQFSGSLSYDPDSLPLTYFWDFGDGATSNLPNPVHVYNSGSSSPVTYHVVFIVTDDIGQQDSVKFPVFINNTPPVVSITSIQDSMFISAGLPSSILLQGMVTDAEDDSLNLTYQWQVFLQHNSHFHVELSDTSRSSTFFSLPPGCSEEDTIWFRIRLTVRDSCGLSGYDEKVIFPYCITPQSGFTANSVHICAGDSVYFYDNSTGLIDDYKWYFDGGIPSVSFEKNPVVVFPQIGQFSVTQVTSNAAGSDTLSLIKYIQAGPKPFISTYPAGEVTICSDDSVQLYAYSSQDNLMYHFHWRNYGNYLPNSESDIYLAGDSGVYQAVITTPWGCTVTSKAVTVIKNYPIAQVYALGDTVFCSGDSVLLAASVQAGNSCQWQLGNNIIPHITDTLYYAKQSGVYRVVVTDNDGCSSSSNSVTVSVPCRLSSRSFLNLFKDQNKLIAYFPDEWYPQSGKIRMIIYDMAGRKQFDKWVHKDTGRPVSIDISGLSNGFYMLSILAQNETIKEKFSVIR